MTCSARAYVAAHAAAIRGKPQGDFLASRPAFVVSEARNSYLS
jgi:hypothetical protein